jgi:Cadherin-like
VYVDGVKLATIANTSPNTGLNWQNLSYSFVGTGTSQTIRFMTEATLFDAGGRGAMLDDIALTQTTTRNQGLEDSTISLSVITASLADTDGSETLSLQVADIPAGAILSDGVNTFTASNNANVANISTWNLAQLRVTPPANFNGNILLKVRAIATETNGSSNPTQATRTTEQILHVTVIAVNDAPTLGTAAKQVYGTEDQAYVFAWNDFQVNDVDITDALAISIDSLPADGVIQLRNNGVWQAISAGTSIAQSRIQAGDLRFVPDANESGFDASTLTGTGNRKQDYASFNCVSVRASHLSH